MKLNEWNKCLAEGKRIADQLTNEGIPTRSFANIFHFRDYDRRSIKLCVYDNDGNCFNEISTGACDSFIEMQGALTRCAYEIKKAL